MNLTPEKSKFNLRKRWRNKEWSRNQCSSLSHCNILSSFTLLRWFAKMKLHPTSSYLLQGQTSWSFVLLPIFKVPHFKTRFLPWIIDLHRHWEPEFPPSRPFHGSAAEEERLTGAGVMQTLDYIYILSLDVREHIHIWGCDRTFIILLLLLERKESK